MLIELMSVLLAATLSHSDTLVFAMFYPCRFQSLVPTVESVHTSLPADTADHVFVSTGTSVHSSPSKYPIAVTVPTPFIEALAFLVIEDAAVNVATPSTLAIPVAINPPNADTVAVPEILASPNVILKPSAVSVAVPLILASA